MTEPHIIAFTIFIAHVCDVGLGTIRHALSKASNGVGVMQATPKHDSNLSACCSLI